MSHIESAPLVSIIIPTYGRADMLCRAINSVLAQTYPNIEVIIINDNDKLSLHYQKTIEVLNIYKNNSKVKIVSDGQNRGGSLARNKGIEMSLGEYITFLDDDDYYHKDKVEKQLNYLLNKKSDICVCDMDIEKNNKLYKDLKKCKANVASVQDFIMSGNTYTPMIMCKRSILISIGMFTKASRFQDHILMLKFFKSSASIVHLKESLFVHNDNDHQRITNSNKLLEAYNIRFTMEESLINLLSLKQKEIYNFNKIIVISRLLRMSGDHKSSIQEIWKIKNKINNIKDCLQFLKSILYISLSFLYKKIRGRNV